MLAGRLKWFQQPIGIQNGWRAKNLSFRSFTQQKQESFESRRAQIYSSKNNFSLNKGAIVAAGVVALGTAYFLNSEERAHAEEQENIQEAEETIPVQAAPQTDSNASESTDHNGKTVPFFQYIIIGGGTAAFSASEELLKQDPNAKILMVSEEEVVPYQRPPLTKELWRSEDPNIAENLTFKDWQGKDASVFYKPESEFNQITVKLNTTVMDIDPPKKAILLQDGSIVKYDKCLIATGGTPRDLPGIPEDLQDKVTTYRYLSDFKELESISKKAEHILIIGGGFLGSELACGLAQRGKAHGLKVTQVFPETGLLGLILPQYLSDYITQNIREGLGIDIQPKRLVSSIENNGGKVAVKLDDGNKIEADHVVVAIGLKPSNELAKYGDLEIDEKNGGICVNAELQARTDLYVAGDVASYHDIYLGRRRVEHYDHAAASGRHAARNMAGGKSLYTYQPMFWSDVGPFNFEAVGLTDNKLETVSIWEQPPGLARGEAPQNPEFKRGIVYYLRQDQVVGVVMWGVHNRMDDARRLIKGGKKFPDRTLLKNTISLEEDAE